MKNYVVEYCENFTSQQINVLNIFVFDRKTVVHGGAVVPHPFGISLFEHNVYFTDWTKMAVMKANKFSDGSPQVVYNTTQTPHGVAVIHQLKQPYGKPLQLAISSFKESSLRSSCYSLFLLQFGVDLPTSSAMQLLVFLKENPLNNVAS